MGAKWITVDGSPPDAFDRPIIKTMFSTGVRAIDSCLTLGAGQRMGLLQVLESGKVPYSV